MSKENNHTTELVREYTLPREGFTYYVVKIGNGKEFTYGKKAYEEMMKKRKK